MDCTADGKPLCDQVGVRGYPTIKHGDPNNLEDYKGGRDYSALEKFAKGLKPVCSPAKLDLCDDETKAKIKELQGLVSARDFGPFKGFLVAADVLPLQEDLASFTNALRWALYSWGDDGERANVFFADFAKDGYQAKGYFGFVDECGDYSPWGHTWAVGTRAELDAAGWAEEAFPNEDVADY